MLSRRTRWMIGCGLMTSLVLTGQAHAQTDADATGAGSTFLSEYMLFGISGSSNQLVKYRFEDSAFQAIGPVVDEAGNVRSGIEGAAYVPGHLNIFGFWTNPADGETNLIYIDTEDATSTVVGQPMGPGQVTGATIFWKDQDGEIDDGDQNLTGSINLNPNNASDFEFVLTKTDGSTIDRDDLLLSSVGSSGVLYSGPAEHIRIMPKGPGSQNGLSGGYQITNNNVYVLAGGTMTVTLRNDLITADGKAMGQWLLDIGDMGSAVVHEGGDDFGLTGLFAIQKVEAQEDTAVDFVIQNNQVIPQEDFAAKVTVLGASISAGGKYDVPVTMLANVDVNEFDTFGSFVQPVGGNVNDDKNPRRHIFQAIYPALTPISIDATSWIKNKPWLKGNVNSHWQKYLTAVSDQGTQQVKVLRHGDPVPNIPSFMNQDSVMDIIVDYIDQATDTMILDENQAIYLFELGTTDLTNSAADFQDLVVMVTLAKDPNDLIDEDDDDDVANIASRIIKVHPETGGFEQIMTLNRVYDSLAVTPQGAFLGTFGSQLFELNPFTQTESLVGSMPASSVKGFENADANFCGFTTAANELVPIDVATGGSDGSAMNILATDLRTIVFMPTNKLPSSLASFD